MHFQRHANDFHSYIKPLRLLRCRGAERQTSISHQKATPKAARKNYPVSVIIADTPEDFQKMYDFGVAAGNGTEERALFRKCLERWRELHENWQREVLRLSRLSRSVRLHCNHNVQLSQPESIVKEIQWTMDSYDGSNIISGRIYVFLEPFN